jgi:hypothetical protein
MMLVARERMGKAPWRITASPLVTGADAPRIEVKRYCARFAP